MLGILTLNLIQSKQGMSQVLKWPFWNFTVHVVVFTFLLTQSLVIYVTPLSKDFSFFLLLIYKHSSCKIHIICLFVYCTRTKLVWSLCQKNLVLSISVYCLISIPGKLYLARKLLERTNPTMWTINS